MLTDNNALIITGPTASGKTLLSLQIADRMSAEIINADMGQFYTPCTIGTAKPLWRQEKAPHHLFDSVDTPSDVNVIDYRTQVIVLVRQIQERGNKPIIVGGSLFYIKSLFFPPVTDPEGLGSHHNLPTMPKDFAVAGSQGSWQQLQAIDPERADHIHPHDQYRVNRALTLWQATRQKPSLLRPAFEPPFKATVLMVEPEREILYNNINERTLHMLPNPNALWIEEVRLLLNTEWESFLQVKKLVGYSDIISWLKNGEKEVDFALLQSAIQQKTRHYAKRQLSFMKGLERDLSKAGVLIKKLN